MKRFNRNRKWLLPFMVIGLLAVLLGTVSGCEDYGFPSPTPEKEKPEEAAPLPTVVRTKERAILAVYEHLLHQAESHQAKRYLADFYTVCDNWSAESEYFKDGTGVWHVVVDMTGVEEWEGPPYWQQASWFVFRDGRVMPTSHLNANALRIEADLEELSLKPETSAT